MKEELTANTNEHSQSINDSESHSNYSRLRVEALEDTASSSPSEPDLNTATISEPSYLEDVSPTKSSITANKQGNGDNLGNSKYSLQESLPYRDIMVMISLHSIISMAFYPKLTFYRKSIYLLKREYEKDELKTLSNWNKSIRGILASRIRTKVRKSILLCVEKLQTNCATTYARNSVYQMGSIKYSTELLVNLK